MTAQITRWFSYGEPTANDRVEAQIVTHYSTGPNEPERSDEITEGTVAFAALDFMDESDEIQHHTHEDGSVLLSALGGETERKLLESFEESEIETGIERDSDVTPSDADVFAFADDGEHATVWEIDRLSSSLIRVNYYRCEAGLADHDGEETFEIDADKDTDDWARECANADPEEAVNIARDYWGGQ